jgi:RNA polymerase sigma-70 factor (ECF subfamily)
LAKKTTKNRLPTRIPELSRERAPQGLPSSALKNGPFSGKIPRVNDSLADASREGAHTAVTRLFESHADKVFGLGLRMCGSREDAEDLVQETFLRAFRGWPSFRGHSTPSTWLYTIAARTCRRLHRRKRQPVPRLESFYELLPEDNEGYLDVPSPEEGPLEGILREEARGAVTEALATMPVPFRMAFILKDLGEFSMVEVGEILGIKEATVKTRVYRARLHLAKQLKQRLPKRKTAPPDFTRHVCFAIFKAKMDALDLGRPFKMPDDHVCHRCASMFASLDISLNACKDISAGDIPEPLRRAIRAEFTSPSAR